MNDKPSASQAIINLLRDLRADPERPISLYDIGVPLVPLGYNQLDIMSALHQLESDGVLNLIGGNWLQVRKPMTS